MAPLVAGLCFCWLDGGKIKAGERAMSTATLPALPTPQTWNMPPALPLWLTVEEYEALEQTTNQKYHYHNGKTVPMTGASLEHNTVAGNLIRELGVALRGTGCRVLPSGMKVFIGRARFATPMS
jgi:Uma2 family endonuclease